MFVDWSAVGVYLILGLWQKFRFVGAFASPIFLFSGDFCPDARVGPSGSGRANHQKLGREPARRADSLFLWRLWPYAVASGMYLIQERHLKTHNILAILSKLPSIERLESIASRLVLAGVILLSVGLLFLHRSWGSQIAPWHGIKTPRSFGR